MSVRVLAVSGEVDKGLTAGLAAGWLVDLIPACGDLPADYLAALLEIAPGGLTTWQEGRRRAI